MCQSKACAAGEGPGAPPWTGLREMLGLSQAERSGGKPLPVREKARVVGEARLTGDDSGTSSHLSPRASLGFLRATSFRCQ